MGLFQTRTSSREMTPPSSNNAMDNTRTRNGIATSASASGFTPTQTWTASCTTPSGSRPAATTCANTRRPGRDTDPRAMVCFVNLKPAVSALRNLPVQHCFRPVDQGGFSGRFSGPFVMALDIASPRPRDCVVPRGNTGGPRRQYSLAPKPANTHKISAVSKNACQGP